MLDRERHHSRTAVRSWDWESSWSSGDLGACRTARWPPHSLAEGVGKEMQRWVWAALVELRWAPVVSQLDQVEI